MSDQTELFPPLRLTCLGRYCMAEEDGTYADIDEATQAGWTDVESSEPTDDDLSVWWDSGGLCPECSAKEAAVEPPLAQPQGETP